MVLRMLLLGLVLLGMLAKPVLAISAELHEAAHTEAGTSGAEPAMAASAAADDGNWWHELMHSSHCCSQAPALLPPLPASSLFALAESPLAVPTVELRAVAQPVAIRPPIRA